MSRIRAAALTTIVLALSVAGLLLLCSCQGAGGPAAGETAPDLSARYGDRSPRTFEEHVARVERFRATGEVPPGFGRIETRGQAAARAGRALPRLTDTGGRESHGFIVLPPNDVEPTDRSSGSGRAAIPDDLNYVFEYFDGFVFIQIPHATEEEAREDFDTLSVFPSSDRTIELFTLVEVRGRPAKLTDYHAPKEGYTEASSLSWTEGEMLYILRSFEGETPVDDLMAFAESLTF